MANGTPISFRASSSPTLPATAPGRLAFYVSKDNITDANGFLANFFYRIVSGPPDPGTGLYQGSSDPDVLAKPGDYFWQPVNPDPGCGSPPPECYGPVRHFTITPLPASAVTNPNQVDTFLNKKPRHRTHRRKVKFRFSSNVDGAKFQCLFASGWEKCHSPHIFRHLKPGRYKFEVRAVVNDIEDADPETWLFRVLRH